MLKINRTGEALFRVAFLGGMVLFFAGCSQLLTAPAPSETAPMITEIQAEADAQMTPVLPTPSEPGLQGLIAKAKGDLAQRVSISPVQINLVEMTSVEWSDSSLDCPQPGMDYLQVVTPGYRILLEAGGQEYEYHSNKDNYVLYCESSIPPISPKP